MSEQWDDLRRLVGRLAASPSRPPLWVPIPPDHVHDGTYGQRLVPDVDYFQVRLLRIQLVNQRQWFENVAPLALTSVDFSYDGNSVMRPTTVGPSMIRRPGGAAPVASVVAGTVLTGPHPVRGGGLGVTTALYRVPQGNVMAPLMDAIEGAASALNLAAGVAPYLALSRVVLNGVAALAGKDNAVMSRSDHFAQVQTGCFALLAPDAQVNPDALGVRGGELVEHVGGGRLEPFRRADSLLYAIERVDPADVDITALPLHRAWIDVLDDANNAGTPEVWKSTQVKLSALIATAFTSPDLTWPHAEALEKLWTERAVSRRDAAARRGAMGGPDAPEPAGERASAIRARSLAVLDL